MSTNTTADVLPMPPACEDRGAALESLLISAKEAARLVGFGEASWWRMHAAGRVPAPIKLGGKTQWRVDELRRWVAAGCPVRKAWEGMAG